LLDPGNGQPCLRAEFGPANLRLLDDAALRRHLATIRALGNPSRSPLAAIAIGMAGARTEADRRRIRSAAAKIWLNVPCFATNDLETALAADSPALPPLAARVLVLSGTGSCCFGLAPRNRSARVGGWGHVIGDRGSGYFIALRALQQAIQHLDRTGQWTALGRNLLQSLLLNSPEDLMDWAKSASKQDIAALAPRVFDAAAGGDKLARGVLEEAAESLAQDALACAQKLVRKRAPVRFVLAGGVLLGRPRFAARVGARLRALWPGATVAPLHRESVWGALELARKQLAAPQKTAVARDAVPDAAILPASRGLSPTEMRNPRSSKLDRLPLPQAVALMLDEESRAGAALRAHGPGIVRGVRMIAAAFRRGGRLFHVGAGTSGRLGVMDATECPPTFRTPPDQVQGIIAGGQPALSSSVEGAEDDARAGADAVAFRNVDKRDVVLGIAAGGTTPFVWGALDAAKKRGARTILLCFNPNLQIPKSIRPHLVIAPNVGPEVLTGSTRLKAGTATKIILNILSTLAMVRMGKVLGNLMVDLNPSNLKLRDRALRIVQALTGADASTALAALDNSNWIVKDACRRLRSKRHEH
jgi:N-acetylmuramic acid 6-phosphate etherase